MLIDTHCHLNFKAFKDDADKIIQETLKENIQMIIVGTQYETSARAVEYAARYDGVYAAVGLHPVQLHTQT
ncbi:MAG: TatD family hydrolase, partial [candidate division WOR-3 bacterium]